MNGWTNEWLGWGRDAGWIRNCAPGRDEEPARRDPAPDSAAPPLCSTQHRLVPLSLGSGIRSFAVLTILNCSHKAKLYGDCYDVQSGLICKCPVQPWISLE